MLILKGLDALIVAVAKRSIHNSREGIEHNLKLAFSKYSGVLPNHIGIGEILESVTVTHDLLIRGGLITTPTKSIYEILKRYRLYSSRDDSTDTFDQLLSAIMSNITCMKVMSDSGERLVDWDTNLPTCYYDTF